MSSSHRRRLPRLQASMCQHVQQAVEVGLTMELSPMVHVLCLVVVENAPGVGSPWQCLHRPIG